MSEISDLVPLLLMLLQCIIFYSDNFPPKIVNVSSEINVTLDKTVQLNITAEDEGIITFRVINKPSSAIVNTSGNVLLFTWSVTSTKRVGSCTDLNNKGNETFGKHGRLRLK